MKQQLKDRDIREPLFEYLEEEYGKVRMLEEKQIGKSRADVLMVTEDSLIGIEIKSDADILARLERQVKDYNRFFDTNILVTGMSHLEEAKEILPEYWGILKVEEKERIELSYVREPLPNPKREKRVKLRNQLSFLWRMELAHIQELNKMYRYRQKSKRFVMDKIIDTVELSVLKRQISEELFQRDYQTVEERIQEYKEKPGCK